MYVYENKYLLDSSFVLFIFKHQYLVNRKQVKL